MSIQMIGIDYSKASVDIRSIFSFTKKNAASSMMKIKSMDNIKGIIIISTCNRIELWANVEENKNISLFNVLKEVKEIDINLYKQYFVQRFGNEAIMHLFSLSCGFKSQILGEDQIITQVKNALTLARENYCTDSVLETLFRMAITAAKKVKTQIYINKVNNSVVTQVIENLQKKGYIFKAKRCMVIGNGEMGKLAAIALKEAGAEVTVTVRQYKSGIVEIPIGCNRIDYGNRMEYFKQCDLVVSATASPNYTLKYNEIKEANVSHSMILIDLAVPRDIEARVKNFKNIQLYDIDSFKIDIQNEQTKKNIERANEILKNQMEEFLSWYQCRDIIPKIERIKQSTITDLEQHIQKFTKDILIEAEKKEALNLAIENATEKVLNRTLFGLKDTLSQDVFRACIEGLERIYQIN